ncbi:MAG: radical SAM protein [Beijerinckiaceae bacterium]|nr:radical SAM protein [Beijerinckiaceae bacterium]
MFDLIPTSRAVLFFSDPGANRAAFEALLAEADRRGLSRDDLLCIPASGESAGFVGAAGVNHAPDAVVVNGVRVRVVSVKGDAERTFASTPDRVLDAEIAAAGADFVVCAGILPFTRLLGGKAWHSCGPLQRPANDGTPRVWCSLLTAGKDAGSIVIEHIALDYDHDAGRRALREAGQDGATQELLTGLWRSLDILPKDEAKAAGVALSAEPMFWRKGAADTRWPARAQPGRLAREKFSDSKITATGERRARVALERLETLWINTGTLCNLSCANCYIESTPRNDALVYITADEARSYFDEIERDGLGTRAIGFTGGEPFLNPHVAEMLEDALTRGFDVLMLTNAMKPMRRFERELISLNERFGARLTMRVSIDHYTQRLHELERGPRSWTPTIEGLQWLARNGFRVHVAGRLYSGESESAVREGFTRLFEAIGVDVDARDPAALVLFPEMDATIDVPEITDACWGILGKAPSDVMCATSRMVVKRKGADRPSVQACTLLAYDERFETGRTLQEASGPVSLNHPHCARFCVLGGAACSR